MPCLQVEIRHEPNFQAHKPQQGQQKQGAMFLVGLSREVTWTMGEELVAGVEFYGALSTQGPKYEIKYLFLACKRDELKNSLHALPKSRLLSFQNALRISISYANYRYHCCKLPWFKRLLLRKQLSNVQPRQSITKNRIRLIAWCPHHRDQVLKLQ